MIREKTEIFAIIGDEQPEVLLIHPAGDEETQFLEQMEEKIREWTDRPFLLAALRISDWNRELSPWEAPPVFGSRGGISLCLVSRLDRICAGTQAACKEYLPEPRRPRREDQEPGHVHGRRLYPQAV